MTRMNSSRVSAARKGFTLVELLVVIGIIALLISILLPSLNRARQMAASIKCSANLRQIGQAIMIYANSNKGVLPYGYWPGGPNGSKDVTKESDWTTLLATVINPKVKSNARQDVVKFSAANNTAFGMFQCPSAPPSNIFAPASTASGTWEKIDTAILTHYAPHPRLMPNMLIRNYDPANGDAGNGAFVNTPYALAQIKRSSSIGLMFDSSLMNQAANGGEQWAANVGLRILDGGRLYFSSFLTDDQSKDTAWYMKNDFPIDTTPDGGHMEVWNTDGSVYNWGNIRYRHGKSNRTNVLYCDGHVEGSNIQKADNGDLTRYNIEVPFYHATLNWSW